MLGTLVETLGECHVKTEAEVRVTMSTSQGTLRIASNHQNPERGTKHILPQSLQ